MNSELTKNITGLVPPGQELSYEEAQQYAIQNNIKSMRQWFDFHNPRKGGSPRPQNIPGDPSKFYGRRNAWHGWPAFLGTKTKATQIQKDEFLNLDDTKAWFKSQKIYTVTQFREFCKDGERPENIHSAPDKKFNVKFSELLCPKLNKYLSFAEAKLLVQEYKFANYMEFREGRRNNLKKLSVVPVNPDKFYEKTEEWTSWPDFLGYSRLR